MFNPFNEKFRNFDHDEKGHILELIKRYNILVRNVDLLTPAKKKEVAALEWVLNELEDLEE